MTALLVTGATGLTGSNVVRLARRRGDVVRALVRPGSDTGFLEADGAEVVLGDVSDRLSVMAAAKGVDGIVHTAALLGTPAARYSSEQFEAVNLAGTLNVLDAAAAVGARTVVLTTNVIFKQQGSTPLHEHSRVLDAPPGVPDYYRTKRAAYLASMERADVGQDVVVVVPGAIYGPAPSGRRALDPTSFNGTLLEAYRGELTRYPLIPMSWVTGEDVASVSLLAFDKGESGRRYLAVGSSRDRVSVAQLCNDAMVMLGSPRRVTEVVITADDLDPALAEEFRGMEIMARWHWPTPLVDPSRTIAELGHEPTRVSDGLAATVAWMRQLGIVQ